MVIDTSAIIVILLAEPESDIFARILAGSSPLVISAVTLHEVSLVMHGKARRAGVQLLDDFLRSSKIEVSSVTIEDAIAAREAYFRYGKGYHSAGLNFADCFSYALAKMRSEPLFFKGGDFFKTDVVPAWRP
ncbi:MAG: type II toxin-antitoxin system VapC family toxin [Xanthobacteraceae bacterium]